WQGNNHLNLKPESSLQAEVSQVFSSKIASLTATAFYSKIKEMLRWLPDSSGQWQPTNTENVTIYGIEAFATLKKEFKNMALQYNGTYSYTVSKNDATKKQLIYVPFHKLTSSVAFRYNKITCTYQNIFNGSVFTSSDNFYDLEGYKISNASIEYKIGKQQAVIFSFSVQNLENKPYQNVLSRPMPGRNYMINLTLNM
ncbi:MAG TPA: TonB-dependent receptor, partial [Flavobacterium sp.]|nr:TonB-dependent receptor [Flavobacterium sp.]